MKAKGILYYAVYEVSRHYGGPEEGGWWFDRGEVLYCAPVPRSDRAHLSERRDQFGRRWTATVDRVTPRALRRFERMAARDFGYLPVKPRGYRGRSSVIGGPDIEVRITAYVPQDYPAERPHYE